MSGYSQAGPAVLAPQHRHPSILSATLITELSGLEPLAAEWDRLLAAGRRPEVTMSFAWARASHRAFGEERKLHVIAVQDGAELVGILPLVSEGEKLRFIGAPESDYNDFLTSRDAAPVILETALDAISASATPWSRCLLENVPEDSNLSVLAAGLPPRWRKRLSRVSRVACPTLILSVEGRSAAAPILNNSRNRQYVTKLARIGHLRVRRLSTPQEVRDHLPRMFEQHVQRWAFAGVMSQFETPARRAFFATLAEELDPAQLHFTALELDDKPIAYHFGFSYAGKFIFYKPTLDLDHWDDSPGTVLLLRLIEMADQVGLREFDFGVGGEWYKSRFTNGARMNDTFAIVRSPVAALGLRIVTRTKQSLRDRPQLWNALKAADGRVRPSLRRLRAMQQRRGTLGSLGEAARRVACLVHARDEILVFSASRLRETPAGEGLRLCAGRLSELAGLAARFPEEFTAERLRVARERLKAGDRLIFTRRNDDIVHVAWLGTREELSADQELGPKPRLSTGEPATLIFDCWTPPDQRDRGIYPWSLAAIASTMSAAGRPVFVYCLTSNTASKHGIEKVGFSLCGSMGRTRIFGERERVWMRWLTATAGPPGAAENGTGP